MRLDGRSAVPVADEHGPDRGGGGEGIHPSQRQHGDAACPAASVELTDQRSDVAMLLGSCINVNGFVTAVFVDNDARANDVERFRHLTRVGLRNGVNLQVGDIVAHLQDRTSVRSFRHIDNLEHLLDGIQLRGCGRHQQTVRARVGRHLGFSTRRGRSRGSSRRGT